MDFELVSREISDLLDLAHNTSDPGERSDLVLVLVLKGARLDERLIKEILPAVDNLERAIDHIHVPAEPAPVVVSRGIKQGAEQAMLQDSSPQWISGRNRLHRWTF